MTAVYLLAVPESCHLVLIAGKSSRFAQVKSQRVRHDRHTRDAEAEDGAGETCPLVLTVSVLTLLEEGILFSCEQVPAGGMQEDSGRCFATDQPC